jgi:hypothetical protein
MAKEVMRSWREQRRAKQAAMARSGGDGGGGEGGGGGGGGGGGDGGEWSAPVRPREGQGLTLTHFRAQLEDLRGTSLKLKLDLNTSGPHPHVNFGYIGNKVSLS